MTSRADPRSQVLFGWVVVGVSWIAAGLVAFCAGVAIARRRP